MQTLQAAITGVIQGLSEFLPISSSAHIIFSNTIYNLINGAIENYNRQEEIFFDIIVHTATLIAVLIYFFKDLKILLKDFFVSLKLKNYENENFKTVCFILLSAVITGIMGLALKKPVENLITNPKIICIFLMITGFILLFSEKMYTGNKKITLKAAVFMAIAQGFAIFPGFSRSGFTICSALFCGVNRVEAARFSFLMSIPVILSASLIYPVAELDISQLSVFNFRALAVGFLTSFAAGYLCIKCFMQLLKKITLKFFGCYCLFASVGMFLLFEFFYHP